MNLFKLIILSVNNCNYSTYQTKFSAKRVYAVNFFVFSPPEAGKKQKN